MNSAIATISKAGISIINSRLFLSFHNTNNSNTNNKDNSEAHF